MKRLFALFLALCLLFSLAACGGKDKVTPTGESTEATTESTEATTETTESTTETTSPETDPTATQSVHTHSYSVKVSRPVCTEQGVKTYTCSCGDSYTETIGATKHNMGGWKEYAAATNNTPREKRNTCVNCGFYEYERYYTDLFAHYAKVVSDIGYFSSTQEKQSSLSGLITAAFRNGVAHQTTENNVKTIYTIAVADMHTFTNAYLGMTYDYTGVKKLAVLDKALCSYDAATDSLVITAMGADSGSSGNIDSVTYTTKDNVHFLLTVKHSSSSGEKWSSELSISLLNDKYIMTAYIVSAENQMANESEVSYLGKEDAPLKILILGNSITRHAPSKELGWFHDWGMAASSLEKDYVHRLYAKLTEGGNDVYMRIRQASYWERNFTDPDCLAKFEEDKQFDADIVIFRLGENVLVEDYPYMEKAIIDFMNYLSSDDTKVMLTSCCLDVPGGNQAINDAAKKLGLVTVDVSCLDDEYRAYGQFEHAGVQIHPGDKGMELIATRIYEGILKMLK